MEKDYLSLSDSLQKIIRAQLADDYLLTDPAIRRQERERDGATLWRPAFVHDVEKILHSPYYNRYSDKTQVFSLYKNDDISRRALHVQLVSRIARNIGRLLGLNLDLIEAIALGHDLGHTPFGHAGERYLNQLYHAQTGRYFRHNVQSVRVLDGIFHYNVSLQVLDGILCHNGEFELKEYRPCELTTFAEFDQKVEACYTKLDACDHLIPSTLEGCVVRISDMIAYIGKDRQDAIRTHLIPSDEIFDDRDGLGRYNAAIINNLIVNIIENSYGKDYITMDEQYFRHLKQSKADNYRYIYGSDEIAAQNEQLIAPLFERIYQRLLDDLTKENKSSLIFRHHIDFVAQNSRFYQGPDYRDTEPNQIVADYIASMTDDYLIDLYGHLFPNEKKIAYISYFEGE